jgi:dTDP-glucose 4,6-dehydratase
MQTILITGGAGFIGSHVVRLFVQQFPHLGILNLDKLTYAGNLENIADIALAPNYSFVQADICDANSMDTLFAENDIAGVIHLAAESHVDRSITGPMEFVMTNIVGTVNLLNAARLAWKGKYDQHLFYHVSTDEVFGSLHQEGTFFNENTAYDPQSPYSASKSGSDHFVRAYANTYGMRVVISNCSNNYGPFQFPEKLIPLMINNICAGKPLPVYGKGENVRDWLYVEDHAKAIYEIYTRGKAGKTYCIGGKNEWRNIDLVTTLCQVMDVKLGKPEGTSEKLITYVTDRAGHDLRYAIDPSYIEADLGWMPSLTFEEGIAQTVDWYLANSEWMARITSGAYRLYYDAHYSGTSSAVLREQTGSSSAASVSIPASASGL